MLRCRGAPKRRSVRVLPHTEEADHARREDRLTAIPNSLPNARRRPPSAPSRPPFAQRLPLSAPRPAPTAAPSLPPTARCSPPSAPTPPGCAPGPCAGRRGRSEDDAGRGVTGMGCGVDRLGAGGVRRFLFVAAVWRELYPGAPPPRPDVHRLPRVLLFALNGFLALVALAVLFGIWFGRPVEHDPGGQCLPLLHFADKLHFQSRALRLGLNTADPFSTDEGSQLPDLIRLNL